MEREREHKPSAVSSFKSSNPIREPYLLTSSKPTHLPKTSSPNTITLGSRASTYEFGGRDGGHSSVHTPPEMADDKSEVRSEEKSRLSDLWNLSGLHDLYEQTFQYMLWSCLSLTMQPPHFLRAFSRNLPLEQNWKRQALPSVVKIKVAWQGNAEAGRGDKRRAAVK